MEGLNSRSRLLVLEGLHFHRADAHCGCDVSCYEGESVDCEGVCEIV